MKIIAGVSSQRVNICSKVQLSEFTDDSEFSAKTNVNPITSVILAIEVGG